MLELNCTVFKDSNLNASMIFWEDYNDTRIPESNVISDGDRTLLFRKNITSVTEEGTYKCRKVDNNGGGSLINSTHLTIECTYILHILILFIVYCMNVLFPEWNQ
jgi:hypothetical protein